VSTEKEKTWDRNEQKRETRFMGEQRRRLWAQVGKVVESGRGEVMRRREQETCRAEKRRDEGEVG
jgi:hypothetical protein